MGVRILGRCEAQGIALRFRQAELIGLLAVRRAPVARATAAALLWPDAEPTTARHNLRQTLVALRSGGVTCIVSEGETLRLDTADIDLWTIEDLWEGNPDPETLEVGFLLPDVVGEWTLAARESLDRKIVETCLRLGEACLPSDPGRARAYANVAKARDPWLQAPRALGIRALLTEGETVRAKREVEAYEREVGMEIPSRLRQMLQTQPADGAIAGLNPHQRVRILTAQANDRAGLIDALIHAPLLSASDRCRARTVLAHLALAAGDVLNAVSEAGQALADAQEDVQRAWAELALARAAIWTGRLAEGEAHLTRALAAGCDDRELEAAARIAEGALLARRHALPQAERALRQALALAAEIPCTRMTAKARFNLAVTALWSGRLELAAREAEAGLADPAGGERAGLRLLLGRVREEEGRWKEAREFYAQAAEEARLDGDPWVHPQALTQLGDLDRRRHSFEAAISAYQEAIAVRRMTGDRLGIATALKGLGQALGSGGENALRESLATYLASGDPLAGAAAHLPLARLLRDLGRRDEALVHARKAAKLLLGMKAESSGLATDDTMSPKAALTLVAELEAYG